MAIETVFGHAGKPHVTGAQLARMLEGVVGGGDWVLPTQNRMKATMPDANTVRVDTGDIVHGGRLATCERYTDLTVESGTSGMRRHDIVAARFSKASDQHALVVVKGTPSAGAATDPALKTGAPGVAAESDMPLYRVKLDGIVPTLEPMFRIAPTVAGLRDSVSQRAFADFMRAEDLNDHESGVARFGADTKNRPPCTKLFGACIAISVPEGPWCFQMAFPLGGDPSWRRRDVDGAWSQWWTFTTS